MVQEELCRVVESLEYVTFAGDQSVAKGHPVQERLFQECLEDGDDGRQGARSCPLQGPSLPQLPEHIGGHVVEHGQYGLLRVESVLGYYLGRQWSADRAGDMFTEDRVSVAAGSACALPDGCFLHDGWQRRRR